MAIAEAIVAKKLQIAIAGMVVLGGAGATYVALGGGLPFLGADGMADQVPEDVDMVMYMDPAVVEDTTTEQLVNGLIDISKEQQGEAYTGPEDYEEIMDNATANASLDPAKLNSVMLYAKYPDNASASMSTSNDTYVGIIVDSEWGEDEFIEELENGTTYAADEYEGYTLYEEQNVSESGTRNYVGVLSNGTYVFGAEEAVEDAIDVDDGSMDAFGGELRTAYDNTRGGDRTYLKYAGNFPEAEQLQEAETQTGTNLTEGERFSAFTNINVVSGSYYTTGEDSIGMQMRYQTSNEADADDLAAIVDGLVSLGSQSAENETARDLLDTIEVQQDGSAVTITFERSVEDILDAWETAAENYSGFGSGTGTGFGGGSGSGSGFDDGSDDGTDYSGGKYSSLDAAEADPAPA